MASDTLSPQHGHHIPRLTIALVSAVTLTATAVAQDFDPFGEVSGTVSLNGEYCYTCPYPDGALERNAAFVLGQSGELYLDTVAEAPPNEYGIHPNEGAVLSAKWIQRVDNHEDREATEPPWFATDAYEWSFELSAVTDDYDNFFLSEILEVTVDLELTEWTEVLMRVEADATYFSASLGGLSASSTMSLSSFCSDSGTLACDDLYHRSVILGPGTHHLSIWGSMLGYQGDAIWVRSTVLLRFSPVCGPSIVDLNRDGVLDNGDISMFVTLFLAGCY